MDDVEPLKVSTSRQRNASQGFSSTICDSFCRSVERGVPIHSLWKAIPRCAHDPSSKLYPDIQGPPQLTYAAILSAAVLPIVFTISWLVVLGRLLIAWW